MQREKDKFGETYLWSLIKDNSKVSPSSCFQAQMATISTGILVFGGGANGILKQQKFYDFHKREWRNLELTGDVLPLAASAITSTPGDLVYGFGGATNSNNNTIISGDLYKIDVKLNSFEIIKVDGFAPKPRIGASLTYHDNGLILFGGLLADDVLSNEIWRFDLNSNSWSRFNVESKIFARVSHTAVIYDSKLVVYGGLVREFGHNFPKSGSLYPKDDIAFFDFSRKQWHFVFISGTSRPPGRYHHSAVVLKDEMYVFGGARCRSPKTMDIVFDDEFYTINLLNFQFRSTKNANLPKPRAGHSCQLIGTKMYIYGGILDESGERYSNELFAVDLTRTIAPLSMTMTSPYSIRMSWNELPGLNYKVTCSDDIDKSWKSFYLGDDNFCTIDLNDSQFKKNVYNSFSVTGGRKGYYTSFIYGKLFISDTEKCVTDPVVMDARAVDDGIDFYHTGSPVPVLCRVSTLVKDKWMNTNWKKVLSYTSKHHYRFNYQDLDLDLSQELRRLQFKVGSITMDWIDIQNFMKCSIAFKRDTAFQRLADNSDDEVEEEIQAGSAIKVVRSAVAPAIKNSPLSPVKIAQIPASRGPNSASESSGKSTLNFPFFNSAPSTIPGIPENSPISSQNVDKFVKSSVNFAEANAAGEISSETASDMKRVSEGLDIRMVVDASTEILEKPPIAPGNIPRTLKAYSPCMEAKVVKSGERVHPSSPAAPFSFTNITSSPQNQSPKMELDALLSPKTSKSKPSGLSQSSPIRPIFSPLSPMKSAPAEKATAENQASLPVKSFDPEPTEFTIPRMQTHSSVESLPESSSSEPGNTPQAVYRPKHLRHYFSNVPSAPFSSESVDAKDESLAETSTLDSSSTIVKRKPGRPRKQPNESQQTPITPKRRKTSLDESQSDFEESTSTPKPLKKKVGRPRKISGQEDMDGSPDPLVSKKIVQWPVEGEFDIDHSIIGHKDSEFYYHLGYGEKFDVFVDGGWRTGRVHYYVPTENKTWGLMYSVDGWDICYTTILDLSLPDIHERIRKFDKDAKRGKSDTMASLRDKFKGNLKKTEKLPKKGALFVRNEVYPDT